MRIEKVKFGDKKVKQIYYDAFPKEERMPFSMMVGMSKLCNTDFLSFYEGGTLCGFIYLAHVGKTVFVMFFAVDKILRSKGYGSEILKEIRNRYPDKKIIISVEPCDRNARDFETRKRRKAFYLRNGYEETGYMMKLGGTVQEIIISGGKFSEKQFRVFFILYSNGTMWPKIWKAEKTEQKMFF